MSEFFEADVERTVEALTDGHPVIMPTDTVYGLAADPRSPRAMARLFELKDRPEGVPVAVLVGSVEQAKTLIEWSPEIDRLAQTHWPGALTIIGTLAARGLIAGTEETLGVRLPDHAFVQACAQRFGPIAATSANPHGEPTITNPADIDAVFGGEVEVAIDGGVLGGLASTVVDATVPGTHQILRQGVVLLEPTD